MYDYIKTSSSSLAANSNLILFKVKSIIVLSIEAK